MLKTIPEVSPKNSFSLCFRHDKQSTEKHFFILFQKNPEKFLQKRNKKKFRHGKIISFKLFFNFVSDMKKQENPKNSLRKKCFFNFFQTWQKKILKISLLEIYFQFLQNFRKVSPAFFFHIVLEIKKKSLWKKKSSKSSFSFFFRREKLSHEIIFSFSFRHKKKCWKRTWHDKKNLKKFCFHFVSDMTQNILENFLLNIFSWNKLFHFVSDM